MQSISIYIFFIKKPLLMFEDAKSKQFQKKNKLLEYNLSFFEQMVKNQKN